MNLQEEEIALAAADGQISRYINCTFCHLLFLKLKLDLRLYVIVVKPQQFMYFLYILNAGGSIWSERIQQNSASAHGPETMTVPHTKLNAFVALFSLSLLLSLLLRDTSSAEIAHRFEFLKYRDREKREKKRSLSRKERTRWLLCFNTFLFSKCIFRDHISEGLVGSSNLSFLINSIYNVNFESIEKHELN